MKVQRAPSGLWVPHGYSFAENRNTKRTVTFRSTGERALVSVDDSGTVMQIETPERLDAIVRPKTVRVRMPIARVGV